MILYVLALRLIDRTWSYQEPHCLDAEFEVIVSHTYENAPYCEIEFSYS